MPAGTVSHPTSAGRGTGLPGFLPPAETPPGTSKRGTTTTSQHPGAPVHQPGCGTAPAPYGQGPYGQAPRGAAPCGQAPAFPAHGGRPMPPVPAGAHFPHSGPIGRVRSTGVAILLCIVTLGIYSLAWTYSVHEELRRHTGQGLGGGLGLVTAISPGIASPFIVSSEVGALHTRMGRAKPVGGVTGLWVFPGAAIVIGPIVWFVKTDGALNACRRSLGAVRAAPCPPGRAAAPLRRCGRRSSTPVVTHQVSTSCCLRRQGTTPGRHGRASGVTSSGGTVCGVRVTCRPPGASTSPRRGGGCHPRRPPSPGGHRERSTPLFRPRRHPAAAPGGHRGRATSSPLGSRAPRQVTDR